MNDFENRPVAAPGLVSYRCKGGFGWIMIGARDHADAYREALRSSNGAKREDLEIWDGEKYVPATEANEPVKLATQKRRRKA